jgi:hypothetical protein
MIPLSVVLTTLCECKRDRTDPIPALKRHVQREYGLESTQDIRVEEEWGYHPRALRFWVAGSPGPKPIKPNMPLDGDRLVEQDVTNSTDSSMLHRRCFEALIKTLADQKGDPGEEVLVRWFGEWDPVLDREGLVTRTHYEAYLQSMPVDVRRALMWIGQGTELWRKGRRLLVTGAKSATVLGHNPYQQWCPRKMLGATKEQFDARTLANFKWGHDNEPRAREHFRKWALQQPGVVGVNLYERGLYIPDPGQFPHLRGMAYSPDDIACLTRTDGSREWSLVEYKCPAARKRPYDKMPSYYMDQIQMGMGMFGLDHCYFVVWSPRTTTVERVPFDIGYFYTHMVPVIRSRVLGALC